MGEERGALVFPTIGEDVKEVAPTLILVEQSMVEIATKYVELMGLPIQAKAAVTNTFISQKALIRQVEYELGLPFKEQAMLLSAPKGIVITQWHIDRAIQLSRFNQFPISTLYLSKEGGIAPKATGWRARVHADPRIFRGFEIVEKLRRDDKSPIDNKQTVVFLCKGNLLFWNGESHTAIGIASSDEPRAERTPIAFLEMIAETRFQTRAIRIALGLPFEVAEDIQDGETPTIRREIVIERTQMSISEFMAAARELGLKVPDILSQLGIKNLGEITSYEDAISKLSQTKN